MESRKPATTVALVNPPQTGRQKAAKYCYIFTQVGIAAISAISSISQLTYAMSYTWGGKDVEPQQVGTDWFFNELSTTEQILAVYNGASTLALSTLFGYRFTNVAGNVIASETSLLRQGKITKRRFITETMAALCSALTGGMLSGMPFTGAIQWGARLLGFIMVGGMSFIGVNSLIIKFTDKSFQFKQLVVDYLKRRLSPESLIQANHLLDGEPLTAQNLKKFLTTFFILADIQQEQQFQLETQQQLQLEAQLAEIESKSTQPKPFFRESSRSGDVANVFISGFMAATCSMIYGQGAFLGLNLLLNGSLTNIPTTAKAVIGVVVGSPLSSFVFFNFRIFHAPINDLLSDKKDPKRVAKALGLTTIGIGNGTWYKGLSRNTAINPNIFPSLLNTRFGGDPFQYLAMLNAVKMGIDGITPLVAASPDLRNPTVNDVVKYLEHVSPEVVVDTLIANSFFTKKHKPLVTALVNEIQEKKECEANSPPIESKEIPLPAIEEPQTGAPKPVSCVVFHLDPSFQFEEAELTSTHRAITFGGTSSS